MAKMQSLCVFCGSSADVAPEFVAAARGLGEVLARERVRLIYGGGGVGLMGAMARASLAAGGKVTGVIPEFLVARERADQGAPDVIVVRDMHERRRIMFEQADAFAILPGGIGTLEEATEQLSWRHLGRHRKPLAFVNVLGFWDKLFALFEQLHKQSFLHGTRLNYLVVERIEDLVPSLRDALRDLPEAELHGAPARAVADKLG